MFADLRNKLILVGSLLAVFVITLVFSYRPGYGGRFLAFLGNSANISPEVSPSDIVTPMVTLKKVVTPINVTTVTSVSPTMSPYSYGDYGASLYSQSPTISPRLSVSPLSPTPSHTPIVTPVPLVTQLMSPSSTPTPMVTLTPISTPTLETETLSPTPLPTSTSLPTPIINSAGTVVINEIAWMGTGSTSKLSNDEWIELYNNTNQAIDLTGWTLKSLTGTSPDPQITLAHSIPPLGFYLLERTDDTTISNPADQIYTGSLLDTGENLELKDSSELSIDSVLSEGAWFAGNKDSRSSMERIDPYKSGSDSANWGTNNGINKNGLNVEGNPINGTPGQPNSVKAP